VFVAVAAEEVVAHPDEPLAPAIGVALVLVPIAGAGSDP